jgi:hypothetical protein
MVSRGYCLLRLSRDLLQLRGLYLWLLARDLLLASKIVSLAAVSELHQGLGVFFWAEIWYCFWSFLRGGLPRSNKGFRGFLLDRDLLLLLGFSPEPRSITASVVFYCIAGWASLLPSLVNRKGIQRTSATSLHLYVVLMTSTPVLG